MNDRSSAVCVLVIVLCFCCFLAGLLLGRQIGELRAVAKTAAAAEIGK